MVDFDWNSQDYTTVWKERARRLTAIRDDQASDDSKNILAGALKFYETHPIEFIGDWGTTYDPRRIALKLPPLMPFVLFDRQKEYLEWLEKRVANRESGVVEKSREMGVSWLCVAWAIHRWLFNPGVKIGFGSYVESKVDQIGNMDGLFEKMRMYVRNLPAEFTPPGYTEKVHATFMKLLNPSNGAAITGEAGDEVGRGGRSTVYFVDEAAHLKRPDLIEASLSMNTEVRIDVSTPRGVGNPFYRKRHSGIFPVFTFHWRDDPRKNDAWRAQQERELEPHIYAQEVEIDYHASLERVVIPGRWIQAAIDIEAAVGKWPRFVGGVAGLDVGGESAKTVFTGRFGPFIDPPIAWRGADTTGHAEKAINLTKRYQIDTLNYDSIGIGAGPTSTFQRLRKWEATDRFGSPVRRAGRRVYRYIHVNPVNVGLPASHRIWPDGMRANQKFVNVRAELWWLMRDRFQKTWELLMLLRGEEGGVEHPLDEVIILPKRDSQELIAQLSLPTWDPSASGKVLIESKKSMASRGVSSPDYADSLALTFAPEKATMGASTLKGFY